MSEPGTGKICRLCGEDCSNRPRIKDPQGHYYCQACHDQVRSAKQVAAMPAQAASAAGADAPPDMLSELLGSGGAEASGATGAFACPSCGFTVAGGATMCINCGRDMRSAAPAPVVKTRIHERQHRDPNSHLIIGFGSMILGSPAFLFFAWMLIETVMLKPWDLDRKTALVTVGSMSALMFFSLWLLVAGFGVTRQYLFSYNMLLRWGIFALIIAVPFFAILLGMESELEMRRPRRPDLQSQSEGIDLNTILTVARLGMGATLAWPVVVLIWALSPGVRAMTKHWALKG